MTSRAKLTRSVRRIVEVEERGVSDQLAIRRAGVADFPAVVALARRALGWTDDDATFLSWKHLDNPFGASPMWVATEGDQVVGFRTFLRWEFLRLDGTTCRAVRAVDTATDPDHQGRGIFTRLTREAVASLPDEGVEMIFNTPNGKSLPGYLKMGWHDLGQVPVSVMPTSWRFPAVVGTARRAAARLPLPTGSGADLAAVLGDEALPALLDGQPRRARFTTAKSPAFLQWRYGNPELGYRVVLTKSDRVADGFAVFRRRRRGRAVEAVLCDVLAPAADGSTTRTLIRQVAATAEADYLIRIDGRVLTLDPFVRLPRVGPVFACRPLDAARAPALADFSLNMGDIELF